MTVESHVCVHARASLSQTVSIGNNSDLNSMCGGIIRSAIKNKEKTVTDAMCVRVCEHVPSCIYVCLCV